MENIKQIKNKMFCFFNSPVAESLVVHIYLKQLNKVHKIFKREFINCLSLKRLM